MREITKGAVIRFLRDSIGGDYHNDTHRFYLSPYGVASLMGYRIKDRSVRAVSRDGNKVVNQYSNSLIQSLLGSYVDVSTMEVHITGHKSDEARCAIEKAFCTRFGTDTKKMSDRRYMIEIA